MTSIDTWPSWIAIIVTGGPIILSLISFIFNLYLGHRHLDSMMAALSNSRFIKLWGPAWRRQGWFGGIVLIVKIAEFVVFSRASILNGAVDPTDIENFPPNLKRLLVVFLAMIFIAIVWMGFVYLLLKLR